MALAARASRTDDLTTRPRSRPATLALAALAVCVASGVGLDALAPGAGPLTQPLSAFAHTDYAWLWRLAIGSAAAATLLLAFATRSRRAPAVAAALACAGAGFAVAGACTADLWFPWEHPPTPSAMAHLAGVLLVIAAFPPAMRSARRSAAFDAAPAALWWCAAAYLLVLAAALAFMVAMNASHRPMLLIGLWERLLVGVALAWCALLAVAIRRTADSPEQYSMQS